MSFAMAERRDYIRFITRGEVKLKTESDPSRVLTTELIDASFQGISVYSKESIEIDTVVQFELTLERVRWSFCGKGKVKNIEELKKYVYPCFRIGIEFTEVNKDDSQELINKIQIMIADAKRKERLRTGKSKEIII
jgi:hypothetical protein